MSSLSVTAVLQRKITQMAQESQKSNLKDAVFDDFIRMLSIEKIIALSNKLTDADLNGCVSHKKFLISMQEIFDNSHIFTLLYELIFHRFKVIKCGLINQKENYFVSNIIPLEDINAYEVCSALSIFIKCEYEQKIKLLFTLTDIDEDGYLNEKEIVKMITTMNFLFCNEEAPVQTESTIVSQSLANIKVAENLNSLMYFPGELKEVLRNEIYINFRTFYNALIKIPCYKFTIIPCFVNFKKCLLMKRKEKKIEVASQLKDDYLKVSSEIFPSITITPHTENDKFKLPSIKKRLQTEDRKDTRSQSKSTHKKTSVQKKLAFVKFKMSFKNLVSLGDKKSINYNTIRNLEIQPGLVEFIERKAPRKRIFDFISLGDESSRHKTMTVSNYMTNKEILKEIGQLSNKHKGEEIDEKQMDKICEEVKGEASEMRNYLKEKDKYGNNIMFGKYKEIRTTIK